MHVVSLKPNVKTTSPRSTFNSNEYRHINRHYYTYVECLEKVTIVMMTLLLCPGFSDRTSRALCCQQNGLFQYYFFVKIFLTNSSSTIGTCSSRRCINFDIKLSLFRHSILVSLPIVVISVNCFSLVVMR